MKLRREKQVKTDILGRPIQEKRKVNKKKKEQLKPVNETLVNMLTPNDLEFQRNDLYIGENHAKIYGVVKYPQEASVGWLSKLTNIHGTYVNIGFMPQQSDFILNNLGKTISNKESEIEMTKDPLAKQRAKKTIADAEAFMEDIDQRDEIAGNMSIIISPIAKDNCGRGDIDKDYSPFEKLCKKIVSEFSYVRSTIRPLPVLQLEGYKALSPAYTSSQYVKKRTDKVVPLKAFVGGLPWSSSGINDKSGFLWGTDSQGGICYINIWQKGLNRANSNIVIPGESGIGKSATMKEILLMEYCLGSNIVVIDPDREYWQLTKEVGGQWFNAAGNDGKVINPLHILPHSIEENDDSFIFNKNRSQLKDHLKNVEVFLQLYLHGLNMDSWAILKRELIKLYKRFGITWETDVSKWSSNNFPVFKDLYTQILDESERISESKERELYRSIALLLEDISIGSDSFIWGKHSTLESDNRWICIDINGLSEYADHLKAAQYYLITNWMWQKMSANRKQKVIGACDEAHLLIDQSVPQALIALDRIMRRARKMEGSVIVASQQVNDFLDPTIKKHGQALLDQPTYKFLLGMSGKSFHEVVDLYNLKEREQEVIKARQRGRGLLMVGNNKLDLSFYIPPYNLKLFGEAGGK